jgi:predicted metallopeptidase
VDHENLVAMDWEEALDVKKDAIEILQHINLPHIRIDRLFFYRTQGSKARAYARTWSFPKIFQNALSVEPAYVIEVLSKYYDGLSGEEKKKVLIHELLHIPKNFSGALLPHQTRGRQIHRLTNTLYNEYVKAKKV